MNIHLSEQLRYLESHQKEFEKLITEALASGQPSVQLPVLVQAYSVLKEVESILHRKFQNTNKVIEPNSARSPPKAAQIESASDINFVYENLLLKIEKISQQTSNILVQYHILRIMDLILKNKLVTFENKETWNLIYFINNIFLLHDIFIGTTLSKRMVQKSKALLNYILKRKDINEDQEEEIKELLNLPNLKGSDIFNNFEQETADLKKICKSLSTADKLSGLNQLIDKLQKSLTLQEQLTLFSTKCQPLIKQIIRDVKENDTEIFDALSTFLLSMIFETEYLVEIDKEILYQNSDQADKRHGSEIKLYQLTEQKEILENSEGLYTSVALIINFFLSFPKKIGLQSTVLIVFKRLYNSFPVFRKNLEDPIIMVLINIQHKHSELQQIKQTRSRGDMLPEDLKIEETYSEAQKFVNYLLSNDDTESSFKEKLFSRKELQQYLTAKNLEAYKPNLKCLPIVKYGDFNLKVGFNSIQEIAAGAQFFQMVEVEEPNSIIFVGFSTTSYDIQFGFYKVTSQSEVSSEDEIQHQNLEDIFPAQKIESFPNFVKVSFIAKEAGIYKVLWSNDHSWFKAKTLQYKISVLRPTNQRQEPRASQGGNVISSAESKEQTEQKRDTNANIFNITSKLTTTKRKTIQRLIDIPPTVIRSYTNIDSIKRREMQGEGWEEQLYFIIIDLDYEQIKISTLDIESETQHELGQTDDLAFILDENLFTFQQKIQSKKPTNKTAVKLYISLSKSEKSKNLLDTFNTQQLKYLQDCYYDIYLMHDCDSSVLYMALNLQDNSGKSRKKLLNENAFIFIKLSDLYFESSVCMRQRIIQNEQQYSYEIGNIGNLEIMTEVLNFESGSGDEASGAMGLTHQQEEFQRKSSISSKNFTLKQLKDIWKDPKALIVALNNFQKICGVKLNVMLSLSGYEDEMEKENIKQYHKAILLELKDMKCQISVELREEEIMMYAMRNVYKFIEIHQQQYQD